MKLVKKESFRIIILVLFLIAFYSSPTLQAIEFDLTAAENAVGKRFASKFSKQRKRAFPPNLQVNSH